jgi:hypothetical protein
MKTKNIKKIQIIRPTLITAEIARLIAHLSPEDAAMLLSDSGGEDMAPEIWGLIERLRTEQIWAEFLKQNQLLINELERLMNQQADDDRPRW